MTKKDYVLIAHALRMTQVAVASGYPIAHTAEEKTRDTHRFAVHRACCERLAEALSHDNPRFDRAKFLAACGVQ